MMEQGKTYRVTTDFGTVHTGKFYAAEDENFRIEKELIWYDEVEGIERLEYTKKTIDKPLSKIGTPHG